MKRKKMKPILNRNIPNPMQWYVLHTKPRNEIKVSQKLQQLGIETFAPTYQVVRQWSDRKKKVRVPYFASYVFVRLPEKHRDRAFCHPGVLRYLFWQGAPAVVRDSELEMIRTYLHGRSRENVLIEELQPGDPVVLLRGALKDQQAFVEHLSPSQVRLILPVLGYKITTRLSDIAPVRAAS